MYIPGQYKNTEPEEILEFINRYSFATMITSRDNLPIATHLPFVIEKKEGKIILTSHMAGPNPQWKQIAEGPVLVIFSEPHAYISPGHYDSKVNVPTWNYISVHVYGEGSLITDPEASILVLESMIQKFEKEYFAQWKSLPAEYKNNMLKGIMAFRITVTDIQAKSKLSQDKKPHEQERIINTLENSNDSNEEAIAGYMKKNKS